MIPIQHQNLFLKTLQRNQSWTPSSPCARYVPFLLTYLKCKQIISNLFNVNYEITSHLISSYNQFIHINFSNLDTKFILRLTRSQRLFSTTKSQSFTHGQKLSVHGTEGRLPVPEFFKPTEPLWYIPPPLVAYP